MSDCVIVFPGQGAQKPGMGRTFGEHPAYLEHLRQADEILGFALSERIQDGPQEVLTRTEIAQPALLAVATGIYKVWRALGGPAPLAVAGHSLGEFSALVAAEVLDFEQALKLVQLRGHLMQQACDLQPGSMAAVIKPEIAAIEALLETTAANPSGGPVLLIANRNSPQQIVLSGEATALQSLIEQIRVEKLGRPLPLKVSGAFHSPLMEPARAALAQALDQASFRDARLPVVMNVSGQARHTAAGIREQLRRQITAPVRWDDSVRTLAGFSERFIELGAATLAPLIRQTVATAEAGTVTSLAELETAIGLP